MIALLLLGCSGSDGQGTSSSSSTTTWEPPPPRPTSGPYFGARYIDQIDEFCTHVDVYLAGRTDNEGSRLDLVVRSDGGRALHEVPLVTFAASPTHAWHHLRSDPLPVSWCDDVRMTRVVRIYDGDVLLDCRIWGAMGREVAEGEADDLLPRAEELRDCEIGKPRWAN